MDQANSTDRLRRNALGVAAVTFFVVSAAAPLTAVAGGFPIAMLLGNGVGVPLAVLVVTAILLIFSVGYTTMARHISNAGSFYAFTARGLGGVAGGAAAYVAVLAYNAMQIGLYGLFGAVAAGTFAGFGLELPWWVWSGIALVLVAIFGYRQIDLSAKVLAVLVALLFGFRKAMVMPVLAIATTIGVSSFLDAKYFPETPSLGRTFLAARLFSVQPELLRGECERSNATVLCDAASLIEKIRERPENAGRRDFFWDLMRAFPDRFELAAFERDHAWPIIRAAITEMPLETADIILRDFLSFYGTGTRLDFIARLNEPMPEPFLNSLQAQGIWQSHANLAGLTGLRWVLYACLAVAFVVGWRRIVDENRRWLFILLLICLANDSLFAVVSGPPDRYHHRILPLLAAATCLLVLAHERRDAGTSPQWK